MNVLVTGGAGYIGCQVVQNFLDRGMNVTVLDNLTKGHRELLPGGSFVQGDIGDRNILDQIFEDSKIDAVMHLAADSLVSESVKQPEKYFGNNVGNGLVLLDAMRRAGVSNFIFSSTAAVYGEPESVPITERHPCRPTNPYGWSKLVFEGALEVHRKAGHIRYIALRYFNAAGADLDGRFGEAHDPETHLIPNVIRAVLGKIPQLDIYGTDYPTPDGTAVRDYIHVKDLAEAHILALEALAKDGESAVYNLGNEQGFSVHEIVLRAQDILGRTVPNKVGPRREGDPAVLIASSQKIQQALGWQARHSDLDTIIRSAWKWAQSQNPVLNF